jgi:hypothetical protein
VASVKIVVLGHPRSGTSSLVEILHCQPGISIAIEPFAEGYASWDPEHVDYCARLHAGEVFEALVDEIFAAYSGLKELSYQLPDDRLRRLATRPDVRVVTLRRRNLLQTAVSQLIAEQTGLWKTWDATMPLEEHYRGLAPLDVDAVRASMAWTTSEVARVDAAVAGVDVLRLEYEDLYGPAGDAVVDGLWRFLELEPIRSDRLDHYRSAAVQQARPSTYGQLPNRRAIEDALGDDVTGHLPV